MQKRANSIWVAALVWMVVLFSSTIAMADGNIGGNSNWSGQYNYPDGRAPVPFSLMLDVARDGTLSGHSQEPATFGNGSSKYLTANLSGKVSGNEVQFTKTYDGSGGQTHSVEYDGKLTDDGKSLNGSWTIRGYSGTFQAQRLP